MSSEKVVQTVAKNTPKSPSKTTAMISNSADGPKKMAIPASSTPDKKISSEGLRIQNKPSYSDVVQTKVQESQHLVDEEYEEEYIEGAPYKATEYEKRLAEKEAFENKSNEVNKKLGKTAVQAVATYFGGPVGNTIASAVNNSGVADPIYDHAAKQLTFANKSLPHSKIQQKNLNKLDDAGVIDLASDVVDAVGSKGSGTATKEASKAAGKQVPKKSAPKVQQQVPKSSSGTQTKEGSVSKSAKNKLKHIFLAHPWIFLVGGAVILLFLLIMLIILGGSGGAEEGIYGYMDPAYDFNETIVTLTNSYVNDSEMVQIDQLMFDDLIMGTAYAEIYDDIQSLTKEEQLEVYKTFILVAKSLALEIGNYDSSTKEIMIQSGAKGLPYCDIDNGCKIIKFNGLYTYVSANYNGNLPGDVVKTIDPMPDDAQDLLREAYNTTKYEILTPKNVNEALTTYNYGKVSYTQKIREEWIDAASEGETYDQLISGTSEYKNWKIYNVNDYAMYYNYADGSAYWWPIGGSKEEKGIYSGTPTVTYVSSKYGWRVVQGVTGFHNGVDIASNGCNDHVIVATRAGTVIQANDGCASVGSYGNKCGGGYGNYVIVDHGDGTTSVYAHMYKNSVDVKIGDKVAQGQKLGLMGSSGSSTGCHLHFEIRVNNEQVDPLQYISADNPRSSSNVDAGYAQGSGNVQTVCLSLKQSGFSDNAVAAIMVNMQAESSFRTTALGDNGTSYGLCQWHNGRYSNLKNYCGSEYSTVKCQLSYLIYELQNSYKGVYNFLLTNNSAWDMARYYCMYFEVPYDRENTCSKRANNYTNSYSTYVKNGCK